MDVEGLSEEQLSMFQGTTFADVMLRSNRGDIIYLLSRPFVFYTKVTDMLLDKLVPLAVQECTDWCIASAEGHRAHLEALTGLPTKLCYCLLCKREVKRVNYNVSYGHCNMCTSMLSAKEAQVANNHGLQSNWSFDLKHFKDGQVLKVKVDTCPCVVGLITTVTLDSMSMVYAKSFTIGRPETILPSDIASNRIKIQIVDTGDDNE